MKTDYPLSAIENSNILLLVKAAEKLGISWIMVDDDRYQILLEKRKQVHEVTAHSFRLNSLESIRYTKDKYKTFELLQKHQLPVLPKITISSLREYQEKYQQIPFPQVIKPTEGEKGEDVYLNITDLATALSALKTLFKTYSQALIEPYFSGHDLRLMTLNHEVIGIAERHAPEITGDGRSTIQQLIAQENARRTTLNETAGTRMLNRFFKLDRIKWYLAKQGLNLASALPKGKMIKLHEIPNYSVGGWVSALTAKDLHPNFLTLAAQVSRLVGLTIMGMDLLVKNLNNPATRDNCVILELNSDPGLRLHDLPNQGKLQGVSEKVLKYIFATDKVYG